MHSTYMDGASQVKVDGFSDNFLVLVRSDHGFVLSPRLFITVLEALFRKIISGRQ